EGHVPPDGRPPAARAAHRPPPAPDGARRVRYRPRDAQGRLRAPVAPARPRRLTRPRQTPGGPVPRDRGPAAGPSPGRRRPGRTRRLDQATSQASTTPGTVGARPPCFKGNVDE